MGRISQWAVRRPWYAVATWVGIMVVIGFLGVQFGGDYNDNFELPDTESTTAQDLLGELSGSAGTGSGLEGQVVWSPASGTVTDAASKQAMSDVLDEVSKASGVECVFTPFGEPFGANCPDQTGDQGQGAGKALTRVRKRRLRRRRPRQRAP